MSSFSGTYRIRNVESGTLLTMKDPQQPIICARTGIRDRKSLWGFTLQPNGGYRLTNSMHGLQARIEDYTDGNLTGSQYGGHVWSIRRATGNQYIIHTGVGNYVAEISKADDTENPRVQVSLDKGAKYQRWVIENASVPNTGNPEARPGVYFIKNAQAGTVIATKNGSGGGIYGYEPDGSDMQKWNIQPSGNSDRVTIRSYATGAYAAFRAFGQGEVLRLSSNPQEYILAPADGGFYIAPAGKSDHVMDLSGGSEANGTEICLWVSHGAANQRWYCQLAEN